MGTKPAHGGMTTRTFALPTGDDVFDPGPIVHAIRRRPAKAGDPALCGRPLPPTTVPRTAPHRRCRECARIMAELGRA